MIGLVEELEGPERPDVPSLEECRQVLADWARYVQSEVDKAEEDIERVEAELNAAEDKISFHGNLKQIVGFGVGTGGTIVGFALSGIGGILLGVAGAALAVEGPVRGLIWRPEKKRMAALIADRKKQLREWRDEKETVEAARRNIERAIAAHQLSGPLSSSKHLLGDGNPSKRRKRGRRRKTKDRG